MSESSGGSNPPSSAKILKMVIYTELIRSFICLRVPDEWIAALTGISSPLKKLRSRISCAKDFHLTLKFLGEIPPSTLDDIRDVLQETVPEFPGFSLSLGEPACFPGPGKPRVLWMGIKTEDNTLLNLQHTLDTRLEKIGFPREKRLLTPHLTLGRVRRLEISDRLWKHLRSLACPQVSPFQAKSVYLMRSQLGHEGATYSVLDTYAFKVLNPE